MKKILNYIPGFRSKKIWKMIIAGLYYLFAISLITQSVFIVILFCALPFTVFYTISAIRNKNPKLLITAGISFVLLVISMGLFPNYITLPAPSPSPTIAATEEPTAVPTLAPTLEPTPTIVSTPEPTLEPTPISTPIPTPEPTPAAVSETNTTSNAASNTSSNAASNTSSNVSSYSSGSSSNTSEAKTYDTSSSVSNEKTVWIGKTGTKYHRQNCRTLSGGATAISLNEALAEGRAACKVCNP